MNINIIAVGKIREKYLKSGIEEYLKRLQSYSSVKITEVQDENSILARLRDNSFVIPLEIRGELLSSEDFSAKIREISLMGVNGLIFVIGGADGLPEDVKNRGNLLVSFSKMTFPHQLMRLILVEQLYRAFRILNNEPYHK